jgi:hypothetical protein
MKRKNESKESSPKKVKKKNEFNTMEELKNHSKESVQQVLDKKKKKMEILIEQDNEEEEETLDTISDEDVFDEIRSEPEDELVIDMEETPKTPKSKKKKSSNSSTPRKTKVGEFSIVSIYKLNLTKELRKLEILHHETENEMLKVKKNFKLIPKGVLLSIVPQKFHFCSDSKKDLMNVHKWMLNYFELKEEKIDFKVSIICLMDSIEKKILNSFQFCFVL